MRRLCDLPMGWCHFLTVCVLFREMDPVFFGWERVNPLCYGREKVEPVYVVPVGIFLFVCRGKKGKTHCILKASVVVRFHCESHAPWVL